MKSIELAQDLTINNAAELGAMYRQKGWQLHDVESIAQAVTDAQVQQLFMDAFQSSVKLIDRFDEKLNAALDAMPVTVKQAILDHAKAYNSHPENFYLAAIVALSNAMGSKFSLTIKHTNYPVFYALNVGKPNSGKSISQEMLAPVRAKDKTFKDLYLFEIKQAEKDEREHIKRKEAYITANTSVERVLRVIANNSNILMWADEFDSILSHLIARDGKGEMWQANLNTLYSTYNFKQSYEKNKNEPIEADDATLCILSNIHPHTYAQFWGGKNGKNGLALRFMYMPLLRPAKPPVIEDFKPPTSFEELYENIDNASATDFTLSHDARIAKHNYDLQAHKIINNADNDEALTSYWSKSNYHFERFILWLHVIELAETNQLDNAVFDPQEIKPATVHRAAVLRDFAVYCWQLCSASFEENTTSQNRPTATQIARDILRYKPDVNKSQAAAVLGCDRKLFYK